MLDHSYVRLRTARRPAGRATSHDRHRRPHRSARSVGTRHTRAWSEKVEWRVVSCQLTHDCRVCSLERRAPPPPPFTRIKRLDPAPPFAFSRASDV